MSKELTAEQIITKKKDAIRKLNNYLEKCIANPDISLQKKAYSIANWLSQFVALTSFEDKFNPAKNISYKRGNVVKVNFGFNVGCELGGPHYAIVLDKHNKHSADTVTVVPLVSVKSEKKIYERDVFLGSELYTMLNAKFNSSFENLTNKLTANQKIIDIAKMSIDELATSVNADKEVGNKLDQIQAMQEQAEKEHAEIVREFEQLNNLKNEIINMKEGSIARVEQITTISKMRIWIPKKTTDVLYGISYSENSMKKINDKLKELYIFEDK